MFRFAKCVIFLLVVSANALQAAGKNHSNEQKVPRAAKGILWRLQGDIRSWDLFYGPGGKAGQPQGPFRFVEEIQSGSSPKLDVRDGKGVLWRVKLGKEAQPETSATRLLWALGYFADEAYFVPELTVEGLKALSRGEEYVLPGGRLRAARLEKRDPRRKKLDNWDWMENPFVGTPEFDGLRVLMALVNNWDLKSSNNDIYQVGNEEHYVVTDLGGTFGRTGSNFTRSKGDLTDYAESRFVKHVSGKGVDFHLASRPFFLSAVYWPYYQDRSDMEKVAQNIPLPHVEWIAHHLNQLSRNQLEDAFRAGGFSDSEVTAFVNAIQRRIAELRTIRDGGPRHQANAK